MYRCILVPLDGTPFGEAALPQAVAIARRTGAILELAHVHLPPIVPSGAETAALPPVWLEMSVEEKKRYVDAVAQRVAGASGVHVETRVMEGSVAPALQRYAMRCAAGLVVMSTHWPVGLGRLWHHGVADQLARDLPLPVLLVRLPEDLDLAVPPPAQPIENILIPLDGSPEAELIIEHAVTLARPFDARLTLVQVVHAGSGGGGPLLASEGEHSTTSLQTRTAARQYLNGLAERLRRHAVNVTTEVLIGDSVAESLLDYMAAAGDGGAGRVDVIALVASERGRVMRLLFRGTADELIREAHVPVLLFEAPNMPQTPVEARLGMVGSG